MRDVAEAERAAYRWSVTLVAAGRPHKTNNPDLSDEVVWSDVTGADLLAATLGVTVQVRPLRRAILGSNQ